MPVDILDGLRERHRLMLSRRPETAPGEFKDESNFAGTTQVVEPAFVLGTPFRRSEIGVERSRGFGQGHRLISVAHIQRHNLSRADARTAATSSEGVGL